MSSVTYSVGKVYRSPGTSDTYTGNTSDTATGVTVSGLTVPSKPYITAPVLLHVYPVGTTWPTLNLPLFQVNDANGLYDVLRDSTIIAQYNLQLPVGGGVININDLHFWDFGCTAANHTYSFRFRSKAGSNTSWAIRLYEMSATQFFTEDET